MTTLEYTPSQQLHPVRCKFPKGKKKIKIEYPGCANPDFMTKVEFNRHKEEFDSDTRIFINVNGEFIPIINMVR